MVEEGGGYRNREGKGAGKGMRQLEVGGGGVRKWRGWKRRGMKEDGVELVSVGAVSVSKVTKGKGRGKLVISC